jgi:hypothetical protein
VSGPPVAPSRFGRQDVRLRPRRRFVEIASVAGGSGVAGVLGAVVIVEFALSLLGDHPKDAEV